MIHRANVIPIKVPAAFLVESDKLILKLILKCKGPEIVKTTMKKNKVEGLTPCNFKTYYKAIVIINTVK